MSQAKQRSGEKDFYSPAAGVRGYRSEDLRCLSSQASTSVLGKVSHWPGTLQRLADHPAPGSRCPSFHLVLELGLVLNGSSWSGSGSHACEAHYRQKRLPSPLLPAFKVLLQLEFPNS